MNLQERFACYIEENKLFSKSDKILVAVSGGRDSMLLLWLLIQCKYQVEIAHCNFQLRGEESDKDESLVRAFAEVHQIALHVKRFDTISYAAQNHQSIQMAARELRYTWFEGLRQELSCGVIAVAQHMNDSVETVLFNLSRGTGLHGLQGILPKRDDSKVVRPILFLQSDQVTRFVQEYAIPYRDDSSNFSNKYARNKIRLDIIPEFQKLNPDFISIMDDNMQRLRDSQEVLDTFMQEFRTTILKPNGGSTWSISKNELQKMSLSKLYFLLEPFGFRKNVLQDLKDALGKESGRKFESENYTIITDRDEIILTVKSQNADKQYVEHFEETIVWGNYEIKGEFSENTAIHSESNSAKIDCQMLQYPLVIRSWEEGDSFHPLGMNGKKKLLSDYFIQKKINVLNKRQIPIVVNGDGSIIWIANYHLDERFKIRENTQKVLKLVCNLQEI